MHFNLLLKERYSVRDYKPLKVSKALITQVLEAGRMAPSANNMQPWYFISICDDDQLDRIKKAYPREWLQKYLRSLLSAAIMTRHGKDHTT